MLSARLSHALGALLLMGQALGAIVPADTTNNTNSVPSTILADATILDGNGTAEGDMAVLSGCDQGNCPDNQPEKWDFIQRFATFFPLTGVRIDRCNQCVSYILGKDNDGCVYFNNCEWHKQQEVCVDKGNARAHWLGPGGKVCYKFKSVDDHPGCYYNGYPAWLTVWNPTKVDCTW